MGFYPEVFKSSKFGMNMHVTQCCFITLLNPVSYWNSSFQTECFVYFVLDKDIEYILLGNSCKYEKLTDMLSSKHCELSWWVCFGKSYSVWSHYIVYEYIYYHIYALYAEGNVTEVLLFLLCLESCALSYRGWGSFKLKVKTRILVLQYANNTIFHLSRNLCTKVFFVSK